MHKVPSTSQQGHITSLGNLVNGSKYRKLASISGQTAELKDFVAAQSPHKVEHHLIARYETTHPNIPNVEVATTSLCGWPFSQA